jgi:hypothetical protein
MIKSFRLLAVTAAFVGAASAAQAQTQAAPPPGQEEGPLITMKLEKNCNVRPSQIYVEVDRPKAERTTRVRVTPGLTAQFYAPAGTRVRAKQTDDSTSIAIRGSWTEAEQDGVIPVNCGR